MVVKASENVLTNDHHHGWLKAIALKLQEKMVELSNITTKVGKDDPRRIVHSFKFGLAITIVSLCFFFQPLYDGFGMSSIWAIVTVVVVFEFSVGATLGKGLNRALATLIAGALGFGANDIASLCGKTTGHPILLGIFICIISTIATYFRFFPKLKARYDYGILIFILTFNMVALSGFRHGEILKFAWYRFANILVGGFIAVVICIFVRPVWAGADLHQLVAINIENLGGFFEGFGTEYFGTSQGESIELGNVLNYKSVLSSKQNEEALSYLARWEPPHGKFRTCHPWKHYQKIGTLSRDCAYRFEILSCYLNTDRIQLPLEIQKQYQEHCLQLCTESNRALKAMATAIRDVIPPALANSHIEIAKKTTEELKSLLTTSSQFHGDMKMVSTTTLILLLIDSFSCVEKLVDSVQEFVSLARQKTVSLRSGVVALAEKKGPGDEDSPKAHHIITITQTQCGE